MKRRALLVASGAWLAAAATRSLAQAPKVPRRIAFLHPGTEAGYRSRFESFRVALKDLGQVDGRDILIEVHWANDRTERLPVLAAEVVALRPEVIVTGTSAGISAVKKATSSIPIVFTSAGNPVEQGFVSSLRHPGGNITGIMVHSGLNEKIVEIAREAFPAARRLAMLVHERDPFSKTALNSFMSGVQRYKFEPVVVRVAGVEDFERAFKEIFDRKADALFLPPLAFMTSHYRELVERSIKARLPLLSTNLEHTAGGGLLSYGTPGDESWRRAAALVDKILRGAKPGDLAVEQPERFELIVNLKTAKAIGVKLSPTTMLRATKVIE